jgi:hypothetical protein
MEFLRSRIKTRPLAERINDLDLRAILPLQSFSPIPPGIRHTARRIKAAQTAEASIILMLGAHVIWSGIQRYLIELMERGYFSCVAMNGAGVIHDYEFSLIGGTTESVAKYIQEVQFGLWKETGRINKIVHEAYKKNLEWGRL